LAKIRKYRLSTFPSIEAFVLCWELPPSTFSA
jgi:hypothetical protein